VVPHIRLPIKSRRYSFNRRLPTLRKYTKFGGLRGTHTLAAWYATGDFTSFDTSWVDFHRDSVPLLRVPAVGRRRTWPNSGCGKIPGARLVARKPLIETRLIKKGASFNRVGDRKISYDTESR